MSYIENLKRNSKILYYFFSPSGKILVILAFLTMIYGFVEMAVVGAIFPVMEAGVEDISSQKLNPLGLLNFKAWYMQIGNVFGLNYLMTASLILIVITVFSFLYKSFYAYFSQKVLTYLWLCQQKKTYSVLCGADYAFYMNEKQGKIVYASTVASESISAVIDSLIRGLCEVAKAVSLIALMFLSSWVITSIVVLIGIIYIAFSRVIIRVMVNKPSAEGVLLKQKQYQNLNEFITGFKLIKVFDRSAFWKKQYIDMAEKTSKLLISIQMGSLLPTFIIQMIIGIGIGIIGVYIGSHPVKDFIHFIPLLGLFVITSNRINGAISTALSYFAAIARHFPNLIVCYDLIHKTPEDRLSNEHRFEFSFKKEISFKEVSFAYSNTGHNVINNISFTIPKNITVALVGESGGGKTTILNLLLRLLENQSGSICIDDVDIRSISRENYYSALGFVNQEPFLFHGTILENVAFGGDYSLSEVRSACAQADASEFIEKLEHGYYTVVGDSGLKLSGGQKQRIGIARALLKNPQILILDEPTSALDNESEQRIQKTLENLSHSLTVLVVAHRLSTIKKADKIIVIKDGRIMEEGSHGDLLSSGGHYYKTYHI